VPSTELLQPNLQAGIALVEGGPLKIATVTSSPAAAAEPAVEHALLCARVAADNKARDIVVLDMRGITPIYDFLVLANGASRRQIHAITEEVDRAMSVEGQARLGIEGYEAAKWVVQDYGDVVVHVFDPEARRYYGLDDLWADAVRMPLNGEAE
jgi:ribosome-associated protein